MHLLPDRLRHLCAPLIAMALFWALIAPPAALAQPPASASWPIIDRSARFHPELSNGGMVVSQEALASRAGAHILAIGGNAVDAAVATGFALAVTFPQAGNLGGGGFMLIHDAGSGETIAVDFREVAPALAGPDLFLDEDGEVDTEKSRFSIFASGVPGTVAGLIHAHQRFGQLALEEVMQPAIELARDGIEVNEPLAYSLSAARNRLSLDPASSNYFLPTGEPPKVGARWVQSDLAETLQKIALTDGEAFYRGEIADQIVATSDRHGGLISKADLAGYRALERPVIWGEYRGYRIASMPPPSSGGVHLVQMLNVLEGYDLAAMGHNSAAYIHHLVEAMKFAYADRSHYLGDPDFVDVPVDHLTDPNYAARIRDQIGDVAIPAESISPGQALPDESPQTTHFSVWDADGDVVSATYTLNFSFGSGISVDGAGFLLNNEMDDFSAKPGEPNAFGLLGGEANAIAGGKRPLSSMTPTIIFLGDSPWLATGSPGGSTIITVVLQTILNQIDFGMNVAEATAAARIHHQWQPDRIEFEQGISPDTLARLAEMGHILSDRPRVLGRSQSIRHSADGLLEGNSDYRWPGGEATAAGSALRE